MADKTNGTAAGNPSGFSKLTSSVSNLVGAAATVASTGAKFGAGTAKGGAGLVGKTASGSAGVLGGAINLVANTARRFPKISLLVTLYAGIKGIQHMVRKNKEKNETSAEAGQVQGAMPQQQTPRQGMGMDQQGQVASAPSAAAMSPEQEAFIRELQSGQTQAASPQVQPQGKWATQIANERGQATQQSR